MESVGLVVGIIVGITAIAGSVFAATRWLFKLIRGPATSASAARKTPSFDLQHQSAPDGWVHLLLSNSVEVGTFHVDVTRIEQATSDETTPYPVKWRGYEGEDRQVVKEALIDLAQVHYPWYDDPNSSVMIISSRGRRQGNWKGGYFRLFSFPKQDGWVVEGDARTALGQKEMPPEMALYLDEVTLHVRAIRIDSGEEVLRVIKIGFKLPEWNDERQRWNEPERAVRVEVGVERDEG